MSLNTHRAPSTDVGQQPRYNKLPPELWNIIIDLACLGGPPSSPNSSGSFFHRDVPTMLSLNLVCLELHDYVQPRIYEKIAITRPSALYALHQVLQAHPERASLVESIHIGPQEILPPYWWPLSVLTTPRPRLLSRRYARLDFGIPRHPRRLLSTSLDQSALPFGCEARRAWSLDRPESSCREEAVHDALKQAQISLGVDLLREMAPAIERLYEVQAALDLYLAHVKSIEEQRPELILMARPGALVPPRTTVSDIYPRLALTDVPASIPSLWLDLNPQSFRPAEAYDGMFVVSYLQLLSHLARPGAITDRFDHPLLFKRSGFDVRLIDPERISAPSEEPPRFCTSGFGYETHHRTWRVEDKPDVSHWPQLPFLQAIVNDAATTQEEQALITRVIHTSTLSSLIRLARGVLASTTSVKTVSLTGFLQHAIGTQRLPSLRRLSLGPPPPCWKADLALQGLEEVEDLRICEAPLERPQIRCITLEMQRLRTLEWSLREMASEVMSSSINLVTAIQHLVTDYVASASAGTSGSSSQAAAPETSDNGNEDSDGVSRLTSNASRGNESPLPLIIARLHPTDVQEVLATAPTEEVRSAWLEGRPTSNNCRRLLLKECDPADDEHGLRPSQNSKSRVWGEMYEERRRWVREE